MIEALNGLASFWWTRMSQVTLQVLILIALVYLFELATRRWVWPQLRLMLWLLVPDVRISSSIPTPAVVGLLRPVVLVPENHPSVLRPEDLRNALLHEMCHINRRDLLIQRTALLLHVVYWFNPLLWVVHRRIRHLTEMSCDARVVRLLRGESESYRTTILRALRPLLYGPSIRLRIATESGIDSFGKRKFSAIGRWSFRRGPWDRSA